MKKANSIVSFLLAIIMIIAGTAAVSAASGQSGGGAGQGDMTQDRTQDQLHVEDPLHESDQLRDQDRLRDQDQLSDSLKDQLGMPGADATAVMERFREASRLHQASKSELNAYHGLLMLELGAAGEGADAAARIKEMHEQLAEVRLELQERIRLSYSGEEMQAMEALRNRLMTQYGDVEALKPEVVVPVGKEFHFDTPPVIREGRMLIPVRALAEGFGAQVVWEPEIHRVTITKGATAVKLLQGSGSAEVNGKTLQFDSAPFFMENRMYVPLRVVTEALGFSVDWDEEKKMAIIME